MFFSSASLLGKYRIGICFNTRLIWTTSQKTKDGISKAKALKALPPLGLIKGPMFPWIAWGIWNARNNLIFENRNITYQEVVTTTMTSAREWHQEQERSWAQQPREMRGSNHKTIEAECILCNTDASWKNQTDYTWLGWVFRDVSGRVLKKGERTITYMRSPLMAEATTVLEALVTANSLNFLKRQLASDSTNVIRAINTKKAPPEIFGIVEDILDISLSFCSLSFVFIPREKTRCQVHSRKQSWGHGLC